MWSWDPRAGGGGRPQPVGLPAGPARLGFGGCPPLPIPPMFFVLLPLRCRPSPQGGGTWGDGQPAAPHGRRPPSWPGGDGALGGGRLSLCTTVPRLHKYAFLLQNGLWPKAFDLTFLDSKRCPSDPKRAFLAIFGGKSFPPRASSRTAPLSRWAPLLDRRPPPPICPFSVLTCPYCTLNSVLPGKLPSSWCWPTCRVAVSQGRGGVSVVCRGGFPSRPPGRGVPACPQPPAAAAGGGLLPRREAEGGAGLPRAGGGAGPAPRPTPCPRVPPDCPCTGC